MPNTPGLFSTRKPWPVCCRICSPMMRMVMSVALPAANGTITRTGRDGYLSWAAAVADRTSVADRIKSARFMTGPRRSVGGSIRQVDLHLGGDLAPRRQLRVEPALRFFERLVWLDGDQLLRERVQQLRFLGRLLDRLEQDIEHRLGRLCRRQHTLPVQRTDIREPRLGQR